MTCFCDVMGVGPVLILLFETFSAPGDGRPRTHVSRLCRPFLTFRLNCSSVWPTGSQGWWTFRMFWSYLGRVRPRQGTELCNFGNYMPMFERHKDSRRIKILLKFSRSLSLSFGWQLRVWFQTDKKVGFRWCLQHFFGWGGEFEQSKWRRAGIWCLECVCSL